MAEIADECLQKSDIHNIQTERLNEICRQYNGRDLTEKDLVKLTASYTRQTDRLKERIDRLAEHIFQARTERSKAWNREQIKEELKRLLAEYKEDAENELAFLLCGELA